VNDATALARTAARSPYRPMTVHAAPGAPPLSLAAASDDDFEALLSLRMAAMRESLQRLGRFDPQRARERLSRAFEPAHTRHILLGAERVGFVVLLPVPAAAPDHLVLDHLYIAPQAQGQGVGSWVMAQVLAEADRLGLSVRVTALKLSDANRFYQRHGFELQHTSEWDQHYLRPALDDHADGRH
jgi:GNAT superfamily N-acetyltransferase